MRNNKIISFSSIELVTSTVTPKLSISNSKPTQGLIFKVHIKPGMSFVTIHDKSATKLCHEALVVNDEINNVHAPEQLEFDFGDEHTFTKGT
ncbi:MAG: hypothetical protein OQK82_02830 [Candidatus Pacearchaeota archaeon]|nr:hypothetical protein [Candidatus Pacearchaeota archaeon]